jgi:hypothetical protein
MMYYIYGIPSFLKGAHMHNLTSGHNVSDFYVRRPKPNLWIYLAIMTMFFMSWAYREGTAVRTLTSEALFILSIMAIVFFVVFNLFRAWAATSVAEVRYQVFLAEHSKAQLELLLTNPTLSQSSTKLVLKVLRQHPSANR